MFGSLPGVELKAEHPPGQPLYIVVSTCTGLPSSTRHEAPGCRMRIAWSLVSPQPRMSRRKITFVEYSQRCPGDAPFTVVCRAMVQNSSPLHEA